MKKIITIFTCIAMLFSIKARAQLDSLLNLFVDDIDSAGFLYFKENTLTQGQPYSLYQTFSGDTLHTLELKRQWTDDMLNMDHYRYQLKFKNIKVEAAEYTEHADPEGYLVFANGKVVQFDPQRDANHAVSEQAALQAILATLPDHDFPWMDVDWENDIKQATGDPSATYYPSGELLWALEDYKNLTWNISPSKYRLSWRFEILSLDPSFHKAFYVDAITGELFREEQLRCTNGPANILTQGSQTIDTEWKGGLTAAFILKTNDNGRDIHTKYHAPFNAWLTTSNITDNDDNWGTNEQEGTTAHWMTTQAWDFFASNPYNRDGMDGNEANIHVHASANIANARFDRVLGQEQIIFGSINNNYLAVLDVAGHEYTHGVDEHTAELVYESESGALDESFADIFGFMVERFAEGTVNDWLIGEDAVTLRSLENPGLFDQPDTYEGTDWVNVNGCTPSGANDFCGVHTNSGVQNFWFHLLADGGTGTNDNGDGYSITAIGIDDAARIAYWNHTNILQSGSQYADARAGAITSAILLFGNCSEEHIQTTNAWAAVGVGNQSTCPSTNVSKVIAEKPSVYPNPSTERVTLSFSEFKKRNIQLYSINGLLIQDYGVVSDAKLQVNTINLSPGIYIFKAIQEDQVVTVKFTKK